MVRLASMLLALVLASGCAAPNEDSTPLASPPATKESEEPPPGRLTCDPNSESISTDDVFAFGAGLASLGLMEVTLVLRDADDLCGLAGRVCDPDGDLRSLVDDVSLSSEEEELLRRATEAVFCPSVT